MVIIKCTGCGKNITKDLPTETLNLQKAKEILSRLLFNLQLSGYFEPSIDSVDNDGKKYEMVISPGTRYIWERLNLKDLPDELLNLSANETKDFSSGNFDFLKLQRLSQRIISYSETNGYPFASLEFDSVSIENYKINARLFYRGGPKITFDTIRTSIPEKINPSFLAAYLNIISGSPYNQQLVDQIEQRLTGLPYLQFQGKTVTFQNQEAVVVLEMESLQANRFEGVLGLAPNQATDNGVLLTGQVELMLRNLFKSGKTFGFQWRRLKAASQYLNLLYQHPRMFSTPLDGSFTMNLLKQDSAFLNRNMNFSIGLEFNSRSSLAFMTEYRFSNSLGQSINPIEGEFPDFKWLSYGASFRWSNLDHFYFPKKGVNFHFKSLVGNKNATVEDRRVRNVQLLATTELESHLPISRFVIFSKFSTGIIESKNLFSNDLFQLGGLNDIRGFNENEFFAKKFFMSTFEIRYFFEEKSYCMAFYDQAFFNVPAFGKINPSGTGVGVSLNVKTGLLKMMYAIGSRKNQPFNMNNSKIHFGFETVF